MTNAIVLENVTKHFQKRNRRNESTTLKSEIGAENVEVDLPLMEGDSLRSRSSLPKATRTKKTR
jgi:hypothetical protein